eukprot:6519208-Karenia_brevis.AAC.1
MSPKAKRLRHLQKNLRQIRALKVCDSRSHPEVMKKIESEIGIKREIASLQGYASFSDTDDSLDEGHADPCSTDNPKP